MHERDSARAFARFYHMPVGQMRQHPKTAAIIYSGIVFPQNWISVT
jgi:hypothetical protein